MDMDLFVPVPLLMEKRSNSRATLWTIFRSPVMHQELYYRLWLEPAIRVFGRFNSIIIRKHTQSQVLT